MGYTVEQIADLPIVVMRFHSDFDAETELMQATEAADAVLLSNEKRVYFICDAALAPMPTFKGVVEGANAVLRRPNVKQMRARVEEVILITSNKITQAAARGMNHEAFGWLNVKIFGTYDEAIEYLRGKLGDSIPH